MKKLDVFELVERKFPTFLFSSCNGNPVENSTSGY